MESEENIHNERIKKKSEQFDIVGIFLVYP